MLVKLVLLAGLWWLFVRDARVDVDADTAALRVTAPAPAGGAGARP
nr:cytochrome oxidase putative small subunit CydP [Rubrivivax gelatinosus]